MNVLITTAPDGALTVHRDTCKKIEGRDTLGVEDVLDKDPGKLTTAKKASCCKPSDAIMEEVEQTGWDALEKAADTEAVEDAGEDLIGDVQQDDDGSTTEDEDLIGAPEPVKAKGKTAAKVSGAKTEAKALDGGAALQKVAAHLGINLGKNPKFPGFGRAFKTAEKQSVYINSKGNADARAKDAEQAAEWATLDHVERRAGNYVRVNLSAL